MATVVSHAMRRYPITSPDSEYSTYGFRGAASHRSWSPIETTESSLAHSMRYAEPWLYGSVRASRGLVLAPALVLCSCTDYINGTKRSNKKSPTVCKKCKGTRIPLSNVEQFGTLRCFPTAPSASVAGSIRGGTVRVSSKSRPSILTSGDPYDLMRRSRLSVSESTSQFRARSVSPNKIRSNESRSSSATRAKSHTPPSKYSTVSRKSILECSVNPYDLLNSESEPKDSSITLVSGQRIRTRPQNAESEYEDVQIRRPQSSSVKNENNRNLVKSAPPTLKSNEKESECNRFKSILKKPTTTFSDTDLSGGLERSPSPVVKSGSHFYLPMPANAPRKKVQFLVENELVSCSVNGQSCEDKSNDNEYETVSVAETPKKSKSSDYEENSTRNALTRANSCKLRRSISERVSQEASKVVFNDTMALRSRPVRSDFREIFTSKDLRTLDGIATAAALQAFDKHRPRGPPPQPPRDKTAVAKSKDSDTKYYDCKRYGAQKPVSANNATETPKKKEAGNMECVKKREAESKSSIVLIENVPIVEEVSPELLNNEVKHEEDLPDDMKPDAMEIKGDDIVQHNISNNSTDIYNSSEGPNIPTSENETSVKNADIQKLSVSLTVNGTANPQPNTNQNAPIENTDAKLMINVKSLSEPKIRITSLNTAKDVPIEVPPSAPPRKRSNNKPVMINGPNIQLEMESPTSISNKTIVKINSTMNATVHKLKIKNECPDPTFNAMSMPDRNQGKTSIMINGDDCYCTVNVSDDVPLYQSSVVVKDSGMKIETNERKSSSVYITGNFVNHVLPVEALNTKIPAQPEVAKLDNFEPDSIMINTKINDEPTNNTHNVDDIVKEINQSELCSTEMLQQILNDPVEAVRRNLVPHVCGKTDVLKRPRGRKKIPTEDIVANFLNDSMLSSVTDFQVNPVSQLIEESFLKLRNHDMHADDDKDTCSEHSSSTQYEIMDPGSDCYTDNSNRSSVTEEEMSARSKFYELLAESAVEVSESEDHHYESIRPNVDPIYEEIEIPPPLPANPPPASLLDDLQLDKEYTTRSIFEGASKYDILSYLVDAKERGIVPEDSYTYNFNNSGIVVEEDGKENAETFNRVSQLSTVSDSSEDSSLVISGALIEDKVQRSIDIERNDSGVGSETSKSSLKKYRSKNELTVTCEDCEGPVDLLVENEPLICRKCAKRRSERKEIITEIVETEEKYSRDLQIILEEFYQPMLVAGLLTSEQLSAIFLNVEELLENSQALAERLRDAVEIAVEQGDEDLLTVNIGKLFLEAAPMLHAFETYCVRQGAASLLLASLEKEKELLRIFLRVSQMENTVLRRMNLNSFLMVPVQRVTKYPLLLARLYKVTPVHHETREQLKESQHKIELHLNHMNSETKDVPSKLWRRISNNPGRRSSSEMDLVNIKLRKIAVDVLEWNHEEAKFALEGKLLFTQPTDNNWRKGRTIKLAPVNALLVTNGKVSNVNRPDSSADSLIFSRHSGVREAALLLVRDKNGRYSLLREPLYLDRCVIAADPAWQSYFEVQELLGKDTFIFKAEDEDQTKIWYRNLQYYAQGMGAWRKRRNALANIMINGMGLRS